MGLFSAVRLILDEKKLTGTRNGISSKKLSPLIDNYREGRFIIKDKWLFVANAPLLTCQVGCVRIECSVEDIILWSGQRVVSHQLHQIKITFANL